MAAPWDYANSTYLTLTAALDDGTPVTVKIDRYLNADPQYSGKPRNINSDRAKDALLNAIANELIKAKQLPAGHWAPDQFFTIDDVRYDRYKLQRVFTGKGSPESIRNVIRLASRYKQTDVATVGDYCTKNIGLDCNGFAGNFWGIDPTTEIAQYDVKRRQAVAQVVPGDAMIFYHKGGNGVAGPPYHLAVVDEVNVSGDTFQVFVAQSAGPDLGLERFDYGTLTPQHMPPPPHTAPPGDLFTDTTADGVPNTRIFFAAGPAKGNSNV